MKRKNKKNVTRFSATAIYLLIAFEFLYMASPFAMYFYAIYKPGLNFLNRFPSIAWMTGFFMPHLVVVTKSAFLSCIPAIGAVIAAIGLLLFLVCAIQIYYSKLFKKKIVIGGIYKYVRHPQYAAFAICSFGLLLLWPRFLTLFFYIILLFMYYWLARIEEKECAQKFGEEYITYKEKTSMFFPIPWRFKSPIELSSNLESFRRLGIYVLVTIFAFFIANGIKNLSIKQLYTYSSAEGNWISIYKTELDDFRNLSQLIKNNSEIDSLIISKAENKYELINYVLPEEMYISEIPMIKPEVAECHISSSNYNQAKVKIIITQGIHKGKDIILDRNRLIKKTLTLKPIAEVWVDKATQSITKVIDLPESERYDNIPEPIF